MEISIKNSSKSDVFNVLIIGNNPIDLSNIYDKLIRLKDKKYIAEIAFDLKSALKSRLNFKPSAILIDDDIGPAQLKKIIDSLALNKSTSHIPITILKNQNSGTSTEGVQEFILKNQADGESIAKTLLNSIKIKNKQNLVYKTYYRSQEK